MKIYIDTREKPHAICLIEADFKRYRIETVHEKLDFGDYWNPDNPKQYIDRKQNLNELAKNVSSVPKKDKDGRIKRYPDGRPMSDLVRFSAELKRTKDAGCHLTILCEHGGQIRSLEDVRRWTNPRLRESPLAMSGQRLYTVLKQLMLTYDFDIVFCDKRQTGKKIIELLGGGKDGTSLFSKYR